ncbi:MAG: phosphoribosylanthranilate isomerase [Endomicrobium sp.]|jgi:phosphoribosylanthranilate isomerase|nr:phosphoribosylanthranilate isomerase [Endomicrobium sp.]
MTKIKICGLKREEDVKYANEIKPDYIGFVFAGEKRKISFEEAGRLKPALDKNIKTVGVFVNEKIDNIINLCAKGIIDLIQLHGDEDEAYIYRLKEKTDKPVIKAVKVKEKEKIHNFDTIADYVLFDTYVPNEYGGSGKSFDMDLIKEYKNPFFIAGGINAENAAKIIKELSPYCVDISSGVETDGFKDLNKMKKIKNIIGVL